MTKYITTYNCEYITNEVIVIYDNNQDILTHYIQKWVSWTICIMSPSLVKRRPSVKTKYYKYFVPKQFTHSFYFHKNSNYWHKKSVKI